MIMNKNLKIINLLYILVFFLRNLFNMGSEL